MSCAKAAVAISALHAPKARAIANRREIKRSPANHRAAARLSSPNGTRESGDGLLLLGRAAEQARHFLFKAIEHRLRLGAFRVVGAIVRRGWRGRFAVAQFLRRGSGLWRRRGWLRRTRPAQG